MSNWFALARRTYTLRQIKELHAYLISTGRSRNKFQQTKIIALYASSTFNTMDYAEVLFSQMEDPDTFAINTMVRGYNLHSDPRKALGFYSQMRRKSMACDSFTIAFVLEAVAATLAVADGIGLHGLMIKLGYEGSNVLQTNLMQMYAVCGTIKNARQVFDEMPRKDLISWSTIIAAYARHGCITEALVLFQTMEREGIRPNETTMVPLLRASSHISSTYLGKYLHAYIERSPQIRVDTHLQNALIYMYAGCGALDKAVKVFNEIQEKDVLSWSTMIWGFAVHGHGEEALRYFSHMKSEGVKPNDATLVSVLHACSHSGLVSEGHQHFEAMQTKFGITPKLEHYGCIVDMLGRAGFLSQAHEFIKCMPITPNSIIWRTLLGACNAHGDLKLAEMASKTLLELDRDYAGNHILMSSVYSKAGRWFDALRTRSIIDTVGIQKLRGESSIEIRTNINC